MSDSLKPLSSIYAKWKGHMIPEAHKAIKFGFESERKRVSGKPFIVLGYERSMHYDMLDTYICLLEGFSEERLAIDFLDDWVSKKLPESLKHESRNGSSWHHVSERDDQQIFKREDSSVIRQVYLRSFQIEWMPIYYYRKFQLEVLAVEKHDIIDVGIMSYCGDDDDWYYYFKLKGEKLV